MAYALLLFASVAFAELFIRLPIIASVKGAAGFASKSATIIRAERISDHWKERVLLAYSQRLFTQTLRLALLIVTAFSPVFVALAVAAVVGAPLLSLLVSLQGVCLSLAAALVYAFARARFGGA